MAQAGADSPHAELTASDSAPDAGQQAAVRTEVVRPPPGLARGLIPAQPWAVAALGTALVTIGMGAVAWRAVAGWRHRGRRRETPRRA